METEKKANLSKRINEVKLPIAASKSAAYPLPKASELCIDPEGVVAKLLDQSLFEPVREFLARPSKSFRSGLVSSGFQIVGHYLCKTQEQPLGEQYGQNEQVCQQIVELLHAGSLIIDDIQDRSLMRRGYPALHRLHGEALALNAGNWLYFWPLKLADRLAAGLRGRQKFMAGYHETLTQAHYGQALDIHVNVHRIQQSEIGEVSEFIALRKTGALTAFALQMGALLEDLPDPLVERLGSYGLHFGALLQKFDDIGNTMSHRDPEKQFEDLLESRASFVWAVAAQEYSEADFLQFKVAVEALPDPEKINRWFRKHDFYDRALMKAEGELQLLEQRLSELRQDVGQAAEQELVKLCERLKYAYTKSA